MVIKAGDSIPRSSLQEKAPNDKVDLAEEIGSGNALIIGTVTQVPAAFSPGCSDTHIPGYLASSKINSVGKVFVISVNDAFVMNAWGKALDPEKKFRFLGDSSGQFTRDLGLEFDSAAIFGNNRSKRYAILVENGKVKSVHVEPDNTGIDASSAEKVLA